jgi:hypothetical protein
LCREREREREREIFHKSFVNFLGKLRYPIGPVEGNVFRVISLLREVIEICHRGTTWAKAQFGVELRRQYIKNKNLE